MLNESKSNGKNTISRGATAVSCQVSGRWLRFSGVPSGPSGEMLAVDVMEEKEDGESDKICELVLSREELLQALSCVHRSARSL